MNIINTRTPLGGAIYPFLYRLNRRWCILSRDVTEPDMRRKQPPTLRWVSDSSIHDLYVEGMNTAQLLEASGLRLSLDKGGYALSKRLSRLMRPYFICGFFTTLHIRYLDHDERERKIWDGAGQVSRSLLLRLIEHLPEGISPRKRRHLEHELKHIGRVEFTIMSERGQDKGHAVVMDDLDADFVLLCDTKSQVKLVDGTVFVGIVPVHSRDDMRLDIQSLVNLYPFFDIPQLMDWLQAEGDLFIDSVRSGKIAEVMRRVDAETSLADVEAWHVREYYLSGGHPMWFGSIAKATINQHLYRIQHSTLGKLRLPIPGGRYYVMTDTVGERSVQRGEVCLDPGTATAWVNADDWVEYIADVLGGADQDDALWCFPFTDHDGERKILCWRSPNQPGEYIALKPADSSHVLNWAAADETMCYPPADSRHLPPRIDTVPVEYLHLIAETIDGDIQPYSIEAMDTTIKRAAANKGVLGQYCNVLMLAQALYRRLPAHPPAPLEQVIDVSVKTGADLSSVREWCFDACERILATVIPIPAVLHDRLRIRRGVPNPAASTNHWLDHLVAAIQQHITNIIQCRDELMRHTQPPLALFQHALDDSDMLQLGVKFNQTYTSILRRTSGSPEQARLRSEAFLEHYPPEQQTAILRAALAACYLGNHSGADGAVWQMGALSDGRREPGIAQLTIKALREIGVLDELTDDEQHGIVAYPGAKVLETAMQQITLVGVWFNYLRVCRDTQGEPMPERMSDVASSDAAWAKAQVARLARTHFRGMTLTIRDENNRKLAYTPHGNLFAYVSHEDTAYIEDSLTIRYCIAQNGDLRCVVT